MANTIRKKNKLAGRSLVVIGTVLAGVAIWTSVMKAVPPVSGEIASVAPGTSSNEPPAVNSIPTNEPPPVVPPANGNTYVAPPATPSIPSLTIPRQQTVYPRLRTRGS